MMRNATKVSAAKPAGVMATATPQRSVSLLVNDHFLDEDQKMI